MLEHSEVEERAAKCNICAAELSIVENTFYGNRCIFCISDDPKPIGLFNFLALCIFDYQIFVMKRRLLKKRNPRDAHMLFLGCIAEAGAIDIRGIITKRDKLILLRILKRYCNGI